jgi:hypothetical protein
MPSFDVCMKTCRSTHCKYSNSVKFTFSLFINMLSISPVGCLFYPNLSCPGPGVKLHIYTVLTFSPSLVTFLCSCTLGRPFDCSIRTVSFLQILIIIMSSNVKSKSVSWYLEISVMFWYGWANCHSVVRAASKSNLTFSQIPNTLK